MEMTLDIPLALSPHAHPPPLTSSLLLSGTSSWSLGDFNSRLSYYDGLIQLSYANGSQYNNKQHTLRSTLISFLCDRDAGLGKPEFQVTTNHNPTTPQPEPRTIPENPHRLFLLDNLFHPHCGDAFSNRICVCVCVRACR